MTKILSLLITLYALMFLTPANAASSSWHEGMGYKVRLITSGVTSENTLEAAIHIELDQGFKTYWRQADGNGIPPSFDFTASENLTHRETLFPVPALYQHDGIYTLGYTSSVVLPVLLKIEENDQATTLNLDAFFGVCEKICVPAQEKISLTIDPSAKDKDIARTISLAMADVPSAPQPETTQVKAIENTEDTLAVTIDVAEGNSELMLLTEGPEGWSVPPQSIPLDFNAGTHTLTLPVYKYGTGKEQNSSQSVRFTLITDTEAVEQTLSLN